MAPGVQQKAQFPFIVALDQRKTYSSVGTPHLTSVLNNFPHILNTEFVGPVIEA